MIIKDNERNLQIIKSRKSQIKYILLLLVSVSMFILFCLSVLNLLTGKTIFLGSTISDLLANFVFLLLGTVFYLDFILFGIYGSLKNLLISKKIIFDKLKKEIVFITQDSFFRRDILKKIPFSEISEIIVEQEQDSEYIILSVLHGNKKVTITSDYGPEGMEKLNKLAEDIQNFVRVPLQKGEFEDIYIEEEEDKEEDNVDKDKKPNRELSNK